MRRLIYLFSLIAALFVVGCEQPIPEVEMGNEYAEICVIAEATADDDSRVAINGNTTTWEVGDRITLALVVNYYSMSFSELEIKSPSDISANGKRAVFRGTVPTGNYYGVTALYPAVENPSNEVVLDRSAANNIFMSSNISSNDNYVLSVKSGEKVELPISFGHMMHKMDFNLSLANGYTSDDLNSKNIAIEISATSEGVTMSFDVKRTLNMRGNSVSTTETSNTILAYGSSPQFSTMLFPLTKTKDVVLTFGVYIDGEKRYEIRKPESGSLNLFNMEEGKSTTVNLVLNEKNSVSGGDEITAEAITLRATKSTIKANGTDSATLSVVTTNGEKDVTAESTIYVNGSKLNGTTFLTTTAGTYTISAERNGVESNTITIVAEKVTESGKTIVFAEGVTLTSGWYDVNKMKEGNNGDTMMCWAAAASNMIQWFQDRYVAAGNTLPSSAITGPGTKVHSGSGFNRCYELALMDVFHSEWTNLEHGSQPDYAISWYFEGKLNGGQYASAGSQAYPTTSGGYWNSVWPNIYPHLYHDYKDQTLPHLCYDLYTTCFNNYSSWGSLNGSECLSEFSDYIITSINRGIASLSINPNSAALHAITLWGYELDKATGHITRIWVTDSDDLTKEPKESILNEYKVSVNGNKVLINGDTRYGECTIRDIIPFSGYGSAGK
jgi:hypothetical protein